MARWQKRTARTKQRKEKPTTPRKTPLQKVSHSAPFSAATGGRGYKEPGSGAASLVREREQQPPEDNGPSVPRSSICKWDLCLCIICDREWVPTRWEIASQPEHIGNLSEGHKDISESWSKFVLEELRQAGHAWAIEQIQGYPGQLLETLEK